MPPEDRKRLAQLADSLQSTRASLLEQIRAEAGDSPDLQFVSVLGGLPGDSADLATNRFLAELDLSRSERLARELSEVHAALERLANGTYGQCVDCGEEIDAARLHAWPTALRCLDCQDRFEKAHAAYGAPHP